MDENISDEIICHCSGTTRQQIMALAESNTETFEDISWRTGAAAGCGACETLILDLLAGVKEDK
jgi:bacterioferritin-associated ferredoxin